MLFSLFYIVIAASQFEGNPFNKSTKSSSGSDSGTSSAMSATSALFLESLNTLSIVDQSTEDKFLSELGPYFYQDITPLGILKEYAFHGHNSNKHARVALAYALKYLDENDAFDNAIQELINNDYLSLQAFDNQIQKKQESSTLNKLADACEHAIRYNAQLKTQDIIEIQHNSQLAPLTANGLLVKYYGYMGSTEAANQAGNNYQKQNEILMNFAQELANTLTVK
jgi:hypothetical protein